MDFETKLAAAGETLEKLAAERGLSLNDFTEQETVDLLTTIMGDGSTKEAASYADLVASGVDTASLSPEVYAQYANRKALGPALGGGLMGGSLGAGVGRLLAGEEGGALGPTVGGLIGGALGAGGGYGASRLSTAARHSADLARESTKGQGVIDGRVAPTRGLIGNAIDRLRYGRNVMASPDAVAAAAQQAAADEQPKEASLTYGQVMHEVAKVAAANGYDISQASPAELDDAVQKMAALLSNPEYLTKQAALQEKIAEADAMGRVMAHAYVNELAKIAAEAHEGDEEEKKEEEEKAEKEKAEKKASFYRSVKSAGEMPAALKEHFEKKDKKEDEDEDEEKKAAFAKAASLRAAELLILNGINPETGSKFASDREALDAGAALVLQSKGYI
jgi:hypothetical protein